MKHVAPVRKELKLRTIFNLLGPLTNPASAKNQVVGVYSKELTSVFAEVLKKLGSHHVLSVHGADGMDEISLSFPGHDAADHCDDLIRFAPAEFFTNRCGRGFGVLESLPRRACPPVLGGSRAQH